MSIAPLVRVVAVLFVAGAAEAQHKKGPPKKAQPAAPAAAGNPERWLQTMTLREKVAQLIVVPFYGEDLSSRSRGYRRFASLVGELRVGGLILINRVVNGSVRHAEPHAVATFLNRMQQLARIPLIVGGDLERGASMRVEGTTKFPHNMAFAAARDLEASQQQGAATAREARAIGIHWVFAPVADVNNNPDNPVIGIRSYGEDPRVTADHLKAYIRGAKSNTDNPVLLTAKHFPGHGDTAVDTHIGLARVQADRQRLDQLELVPFRAAVESKVDSIMTAHLAVPALDSTEAPATVSAAVLTDLLRKDLGFRGIIVTDAMDMNGLAGQLAPGEAAVRAVEAGTDVLLMPPQPEAAVNALVAAVQKKRLSLARIEQSVAKVLAAKIALGLHKKRTVEMNRLADGIESEDSDRVAVRVAENAITLVRNERGLVPLANPGTSCWYVLSENRYGQQGRQMIDTLTQRVPQARSILLDPQMPEEAIGAAADWHAGCETLVIAAYANVSANRGTAGLSEPYAHLVESLIAAKPAILVSLGDPYLIRAFPGIGAYLAAFSTVPVSEAAVVRAILGDIPIRGKLPVTIPAVARAGDGIQLPARVAP